MGLMDKMFGKKYRTTGIIKHRPIQTRSELKNKRQRYNDLIGSGKYSAVEALMIIERDIKRTQAIRG